MADWGSDVTCDVQQNVRKLVCSIIKENADSQAICSSSKNVEPVLLCWKLLTEPGVADGEFLTG